MDQQADLKAYAAAMSQSDVDACIAIEKRNGLFGLPPELVRATLAGRVKYVGLLG